MTPRKKRRRPYSHYRKTAPSRRRQYRRRRRRRLFLLPLLLLLCALTYRYPQEARNFLATFHVSLPAFSARTDIFSGISFPNLTVPALKADPAARSSPAADNPVSSNSGSEDLAIHFLDVGEGLSVLVLSGEHALLYDGGGRDTSSFVVSYLKEQEIKSFDYIIASHYDADHLSGLIGVLHTFSAETVLGPDYIHDSGTYDSFMDTLDDLGLSPSHPAVGDVYSLGSASFTVLAPSEITDDSNNNSIVIRIVHGANSFLLMGDAESDSEYNICRLGLSLSSDVICPGHHGSADATGSELLQYVQPQYAVISVGADNEYGHPHQATLDRLADAGAEILRTDELGTIIAYSDGSSITWKTDN